MYDDRRYVEEILPIEVLVGKTLTKIWNKDEQELIFYTTDGEIYSMTHDSDCCEKVSIEDIDGDLDDLIGVPVLLAEESTSDNLRKAEDDDYEKDLQLWTFYKFNTKKGYVTIRWYGCSNGYYSVNVDFKKLNKEEENE